MGHRAAPGDLWADWQQQTASAAAARAAADAALAQRQAAAVVAFGDGTGYPTQALDFGDLRVAAMPDAQGTAGIYGRQVPNPARFSLLFDPETGAPWDPATLRGFPNLDPQSFLRRPLRLDFNQDQPANIFQPLQVKFWGPGVSADRMAQFANDNDAAEHSIYQELLDAPIPIWHTSVLVHQGSYLAASLSFAGDVGLATGLVGAGRALGAASVAGLAEEAASEASLAPAGISGPAHIPLTGSEWFEYFSARYGAENVQWSRLPQFTGPRSAGGTGTLGVLRTALGDFEVASGRAGPAASLSGNGFDIVSRMHAEGHASAIMRQLGQNEGILFINNPEICVSCLKNLNRMIPPGGNITVVLPNGTLVPFPR